MTGPTWIWHPWPGWCMCGRLNALASAWSAGTKASAARKMRWGKPRIMLGLYPRTVPVEKGVLQIFEPRPGSRLRTSLAQVHVARGDARRERRRATRDARGRSGAPRDASRNGLRNRGRGDRFGASPYLTRVGPDHQPGFVHRLEIRAGDLPEPVQVVVVPARIGCAGDEPRAA